MVRPGPITLGVVGCGTQAVTQIHAISRVRPIERLVVTDTGIGIPESEQERIFEEFVQVESGSLRSHGGTGLGLPICKRIVEGQGGEISLRNKVIQSAIKKAKTLPSPLQGAFLKAYPELTEEVLQETEKAAAAQAPSKPLGRDQSRAEHKQSKEEQSGKGERERETTDRQLAEKLVAACPRPDLTIKAIAAAQQCLIRHRGAIEFPEILEAVQKSTAAVREWPEDERITYTPEAARYFAEDHWRKSPDSWKSRRQARRAASNPVQPTLSTGSGRKFKLLDDIEP